MTRDEAYGVSLVLDRDGVNHKIIRDATGLETYAGHTVYVSVDWSVFITEATDIGPVADALPDFQLRFRGGLLQVRKRDG